MVTVAAYRWATVNIPLGTSLSDIQQGKFTFDLGILLNAISCLIHFRPRILSSLIAPSLCHVISFQTAGHPIQSSFL